MSVWQALLLAVVIAPGVVFGALSLLWLLGWTASERVLTRITAATYTLAATGVAALLWHLAATNSFAMSLRMGDWFVVHGYEFPLVLQVDRLSLPFLALTVVLVGLIGQFSATYLHRDHGFLRFYLLLHLFAFGSLLLFSAGSFDLLVGGWELVGITSVLLIAFFQYRSEPVDSALRVFGVYRACDIGLLVAVFAMHHFAGTASMVGGPPVLTGGQATVVGLLLLLAASGKSAQVPFSGWLPRAMEGPTPSSAIFYGAISVHAGSYLLLRAQPILAESGWATAAVITIGALTALHGTIVGRACSDAKTSLAYASLAQLGVIYVEIGLGWTWLAVAHILGHAVSRTLQFLRAPSMLHDYHQMHAAAGGHLAQTGQHYESALPSRVQLWLYRHAMDRGHLDTILDRLVVFPLHSLSAVLGRVDQWGVQRQEPRRRQINRLTLPVRTAGQDGVIDA